MRHRAKSLTAAIEKLNLMQSARPGTWFRGQTRPWPLLSSFIRRDQAGRDAAIKRFGAFAAWLQDVPALAAHAVNEDEAFAIAQHYGFPTTLVDFTTDLNVAAFFASHEPPPVKAGEEDLSCIICLNWVELERFLDSIRDMRPEVAALRAIRVEVPGLWRLEAQRGLFLEYPFDESFERHAFDFDRIVFPTERDPSVLSQLIRVEDVYPTQKSDLEVQLDQFFMLMRMEEGSADLHRMSQEGTLTVVEFASDAAGYESECFGPDGLPEHGSWRAEGLVQWLSPPREAWRPLTRAPEIEVPYQALADSKQTIERLVRILAGPVEAAARESTLRWRLQNSNADAAHVQAVERALELVWDGLRPWPFSTRDVARALAVTVELALLVAQTPNARALAAAQEALAERCLGALVEVEIGIEDGSYTRAFACRDSLVSAVRDDFAHFLNDEFRSQVKEVEHVLQLAPTPRRTFVFEKLCTIFCTECVPTQVVLRDEPSGKARLYNPARMTSFGLL